MRTVFVVAAAVMLFVPDASADWLFTPSWGMTFGQDTHGREHGLVSATVGVIDDDPLGWEIDLSFAPDFFEGHHRAFDFTGDSHVGTLMFNGVLGDLTGILHTRSVRPYVTAGLGLIQVRTITEGARGRVDKWINQAGWDAGGGIAFFLGKHLGVRADMRYFRTFPLVKTGSWTYDYSTVDVAPGQFDYLRGTIGVTFRWPPTKVFSTTTYTRRPPDVGVLPVPDTSDGQVGWSPPPAGGDEDSPTKPAN